MKKTKFVLLALLLTTFGCDKDNEISKEEIEPPKLKVEVPRNVVLLSGDHQKGFPGRKLNDSIRIKICPNKIEDLDRYKWEFKMPDYYPVSTATSSIKDNELYLTVAWQLARDVNEQQLQFNLYACDDEHSYHQECDTLASLIMNASLKETWLNVYKKKEGYGYGEFLDMHFSDENTGIAIGEYSSTYVKTDDGGNSWYTASTTSSSLYQLSFADRNNGIVIVTNNWAYFTSDGGQTFESGEWTPPIIGHQSSGDYFMLSTDEIVTVGRNGDIAKTIDGGKSWNTYEGFAFGNWLRSVTCTDANTYYACGAIAKLVKTSNGGETWVEQEALLNNDLEVIYFLDNEFGFAAGQNGSLIRTTNGGDKWDVIKSGLRFSIIEINFTSKTVGYIVSKTGEIAKTEDAGLSWKLVNADQYGVNELNKVYFKMPFIFGLQRDEIYKYNLEDE